MNEEEFLKLLVCYKEDHFSRTRRKSQKVLFKWIWDDFLFDLNDKNICFIKKFTDFTKFINNSDNFSIGIISSSIFAKIENFIYSYIVIPFNLSNFFQILNIKSTTNFLKTFRDFNIFKNFIENYNQEQSNQFKTLYEYCNFLFSENVYEINDQIIDYENFPSLSKVLYLIFLLRQDIDDSYKNFFINYYSEILINNKLQIVIPVLTKVIKSNLINEFFNFFFYFLNILHSKTNFEEIFNFKEELFEIDEFNQLKFVLNDKMVFFKILEDFSVIVSNSKLIKINELIEEAFHVYKESPLFIINSKFKEEFSLKYFSYLIDKLITTIQNEDSTEIDLTLFRKNRYFSKYESLIDILLIARELSVYLKKEYTNNQAEIIIQYIYDFERLFYNILRLDFIEILSDENKFIQIYEILKKKINDFWIDFKPEDISFNKICSRIDFENNSCMILELNEYNFRFSSLIRDVLRFKYQYKEKCYFILPHLIDFEKEINTKLNKITLSRNDDQLYFLKNIKNNKKINNIVFQNDINFEFFKMNLCELIFNKLSEIPRIRSVLIYSKSKNNQFFIQVYHIEKENIKKLRNLKIKISPNHIFIKTIQTIEFSIKNSNKWPILISNLKVSLKFNETKIFEEIKIEGYKTVNLNFQVYFIKPGSYSCKFNIEYGIFDNNELILKTNNKRELDLIAEETPIEIQKKREQDNYFNKYL